MACLGCFVKLYMIYNIGCSYVHFSKSANLRTFCCRQMTHVNAYAAQNDHVDVRSARTNFSMASLCFSVPNVYYIYKGVQIMCELRFNIIRLPGIR